MKRKRWQSRQSAKMQYGNIYFDRIHREPSLKPRINASFSKIVGSSFLCFVQRKNCSFGFSVNASKQYCVLVSRRYYNTVPSVNEGDTEQNTLYFFYDEVDCIAILLLKINTMVPVNGNQ